MPGIFMPGVLLFKKEMLKRRKETAVIVSRIVWDQVSTVPKASGQKTSRNMKKMYEI